MEPMILDTGCWILRTQHQFFLCAFCVLCGDTAIFTSGTWKLWLPPAQLQKDWDKVEYRYGAYRSHSYIETTSSGAYQIVRISCELAQGTVEVRIAVDSHLQISGFRVYNEAPTHS